MENSALNVTKLDGSKEPLAVHKITKSLEWASGEKYKHLVGQIQIDSKIHFYDGISTEFINDIMIKTCRDNSDLRNMGMDVIAKNLMLQKIYKQVNKSIEPRHLQDILTSGINLGVYNPKLAELYSTEELNALHNCIDFSRDFDFTASGLEALVEKYMKSVDNKLIELPQHMYMLIAMDIFRDWPTDERLKLVVEIYNALSTFQITLPTPEMNALRTPSSDYASCVLLKIGDFLLSWNEATKAIVLHTAASAGIGIDISGIASIGDLVKQGKIVHGGKVPELASIDKDIQKATQNGRRGSGTAFVNFFDPEIVRILSLKSPRTEVGKRINDLSYGIKVRDLVYERASTNENITLFSIRQAPDLYEIFHSGTQAEFKEAYSNYEKQFPNAERIPAQYFLEALNTECFENSSYYIMNVDEVNMQSPYQRTIYQSNICMEEVSPTRDLDPNKPDSPDIAICVLTNINQSKVSIEELPRITYLVVAAQTNIMLRQNHPMPQANAYVKLLRSIGIGFSNHAHWLAKQNFKYGQPEALKAHDEWMEHFQYGLINASNQLVPILGKAPLFDTESNYAKGIMPIDKYKATVNELVDRAPSCDWQGLRERVLETGMANVALSMVPPSESSSVPSGQTSGMEPIKDLITFKETKAGINKQFAPDAIKLADKYDYAYNTKDMTQRYLKNVAVTQKWIDKSISTNRFYNPTLFPDDKVPLKLLLSDMYFSKYYGIKTLYYTNTFIPDVEENTQQSCAGGGCDV